MPDTQCTQTVDEEPARMCMYMHIHTHTCAHTHMRTCTCAACTHTAIGGVFIPILTLKTKGFTQPFV